MLFRQLIDSETSTYTYLLADSTTKEAILIDAVREQFERDSQILDELGLKLLYTLDTHLHADHITSSGLFRQSRSSLSVISKAANVPCADKFVEEGDRIVFGKHSLSVLETPGHTNTCVTYVLDDQGLAFTGDALLIRGCGRTDFQQGSPEKLFNSVRNKIFKLPLTTLLYPGHDYKGRTVSSVAEEREHNARLKLSINKEQFVQIMQSLQLSYPKKIDVALPANRQCGLIFTPPDEPELSPSSEDAWGPIVRRGAIAEVAVDWVRTSPVDVLLIDVRRPDEVHGELPHIPSAELIPLASLQEELDDWGRDCKIVTICRSGKRSIQAAVLLGQMGFDSVASMSGGMMAYHSKKNSSGCG